MARALTAALREEGGGCQGDVGPLVVVAFAVLVVVEKTAAAVPRLGGACCLTNTNENCCITWVNVDWDRIFRRNVVGLTRQISSPA